MNPHDERDQYRLRALQAAATLSDRPRPEPDGRPCVGELYLSRKTAGFPVEWLVIEAEGPRLRVVPVDEYPLTGSRDVDLSSDRAPGVAVARCGHSDWVNATVFEPELRTDMLETTVLQSVHDKRRDVDADRVEPTVLESVADADPEYQSWSEGTLTPAVAVLTEPVRVEQPVPFRRLRHHWQPILAIAALLAITVSLGVLAVRLDGELDGTRSRLAELEGVLPAQQDRLAEEVQRREAADAEVSRLDRALETAGAELGAARQEVGSLTERLGSVERKLRRALEAGVVANVKKLVFGAAQRIDVPSVDRGRTVVTDADSSPRLFFELEIVDPEPYFTYRVRFVPTKAGETAVVEGLRREGAWLRFSLPADRLAIGEYDILIQGTGFGETAELAERYRLTVEP